MFGEGKHTELEEARLREAAVEKPMVTRDTISDTGFQTIRGRAQSSSDLTKPGWEG